jgi:hypothetical protein
MIGQQAHRLGDAAGVPTCQINNVILVQSPGKALREAEAKITGRTRDDRYLCHAIRISIIIVVNMLIATNGLDGRRLIPSPATSPAA